jgi:CNT family concentrative nucleoside transporter
MDRLHGLIGVAFILGIAFLFSNNRKRINLRLVLSGITLQVVIALLIFKVEPVARFFKLMGEGIGKLEQFARAGAAFVYGGIAVEQGPGRIGNFMAGGFVFAFNVTAMIILVCALVAVLYHYGIMQRVVAIVAKAMNFVMRVSGA